MKEESASKIKYGVWGIIVGAIIVMITGFAWGDGQPPVPRKK